jgi:transcriptional regulator
VLAHLAELARVHEAQFANPWTLASAPRDHLAGLLPHIAAFTLEIEAIQGKRKLSQNRAAADREGVISGLRERAEGDDHAIAEAMAVYPYASQEAQSLVGPVAPSGSERVHGH